MNATELRELDTWIHRHIFEVDLYVGLKKRGFWWRPNSCGYTGNQDEAGRYTRAEAAKKAQPDGEPVTIREFEPKKYTTDSAAAMEVLKKCAEKMDRYQSVTLVKNGDTFTICMATPVRYEQYDYSHHATDETIELAICLFAKKLFSK